MYQQGGIIYVVSYAGRKVRGGRVSDRTRVAVKSLASVVNSAGNIYTHSRDSVAFGTCFTMALWGDPGFAGRGMTRLDAFTMAAGYTQRIWRIIFPNDGPAVLYIIYDNIIAYARCNNIIFRSEFKVHGRTVQ
jgi:hypothetical protein